MTATHATPPDDDADAIAAEARYSQAIQDDAVRLRCATLLLRACYCVIDAVDAAVDERDNTLLILRYAMIVTCFRRRAITLHALLTSRHQPVITENRRAYEI